jgi:hypothetical protein
VAVDLIQKWRGREGPEEPENYQPEKCPPGLAEDWTNTENPGDSDHAKWEWDLLVDLAYIADSNPGTIRENVQELLTGLTKGENPE